MQVFSSNNIYKKGIECAIESGVKITYYFNINL